MEIGGKVVGVGVLLVVVGGGLLIGYPAFQRAKQIATLSEKQIDVSMHDQGKLDPTKAYYNDGDCTVQFPGGMPHVTSVSIPTASFAIKAGRPGEKSFGVALFDRGSNSFDTYVRGSRLELRKALKDFVIDDEGNAQINGMRAYVMTVRFAGPFGTAHERMYLIEGPGTKVYLLTAFAPAEEWSAFAEVADSAASTFETGDHSWNPPTPPAMANASPTPTPGNPARAAFPGAPGPAANGGQSPPSPPMPSGSQGSSFAQRPPTPGFPPAPRRERPIEVQLNGNWELAFVQDEKDDQVQVRYARYRPEGERIVWVKKDQTRPWGPQRSATTRPGPAVARSTPAAPSGPGEEFRAGQRVEVWWGSKWWPAKVVSIENGKAVVDYDDWTQNETVGFDHVRRVGSNKPSPNEMMGRMGGRAAAATMTTDDACALLIARSPFDRARGAEALAAMTPDKEHQANVIKALASVLRDNSIHNRTQAARALGVWADAATEKAFIDRLISGRKDERQGIFEMLGARKTVTAARALARRLRVPEDATAVETELKQMGSVAEPAVRETLADADKGVRRRSAEILGVIGTKGSVPALKKASADADAAVSISAKVAMKRIEEQ